MHLGLSFGMHQYLECVICEGAMPDNHTSDCPAGRLKALVDRFPILVCKKCRKPKVYPCVGDFLQCTECRTIYSRGAAGPYDTEKLEKVLYDLPGEHDLVVFVVFPDKGTAPLDEEFPILKRINDLQKEVDAARKAAKRKKRS